MNTEHQINLKKIYNHFGREPQLKKLAEECSEFLQAYLKGQEYHTLEEIGDLKVLVDQFYEEEITVQQTYRNKISRTIERIKSGYYER